jgi:drug/metabolite transporter (DMT)-like permease
MSSGRRSMLLMAGFVFLWTAVELLAASLLVKYSPYQVVWMRYGVHLVAMLLVFGWTQPASLWRTARPARQWLRSLLMLAMPASWIMGTQHGVQPDTLMAVFWTSPLLIMALAHLLLGERAPWELWLAGALSCVGANLLFVRGPLPLSMELLFPLGMALSFSLYVVMTRTLRHEPLRVNLFYTAVGVFVALSPAMPGLWRTPSTGDLLAMVGVGLLGWATLYALDRMAATAEVSQSAPVLSLQLVFLLAAGWLAGQPASGWRAVAGPAMILAVAILLWLGEQKWRVRQGPGPWTRLVRGAD